MYLIKASEIGDYLFCARAWRLRRDGYEPTSGQQALAAGSQWHTEHGQSVLRVQRLRLVAIVSTFLAFVIALASILIWLRG